MKKRYLAIGSVVFLVLFLRKNRQKKEVKQEIKPPTQVLDFGKEIEHKEKPQDTASVIPAVKTEVPLNTGISTTGTPLTTKVEHNSTAHSVAPTTAPKTNSSPITTDKSVTDNEAILNKLDEMANTLKEVKESDYTKFIGDEKRKNKQNEEISLTPVENVEEPYLGKLRQIRELPFVTTQRDEPSEAYYQMIRDSFTEIFQPLFDNPTKELYNEKLNYFSNVIGFASFGIQQAKEETPHLLTAYVETYQYLLNIALILKEDIISLGTLNEEHFNKLLQNLDTFKGWLNESTNNTAVNSSDVSSVISTPNEDSDYAKFVEDEERKNKHLIPIEDDFDRNLVIEGIQRIKSIFWQEPEGIGEIGKNTYLELKTALENKYVVFDGDFTKSDVLNFVEFINSESNRINHELSLIRNRDLSIVYQSYRQHLEKIYTSIVSVVNVD